VPRPARIALVALGVAIALYGIASLTGGWLGEPPWWITRETIDVAWPGDGSRLRSGSSWRVEKATEGREVVSVALCLVGGALAVVAWPRKPRTRRGAW
jgi:hypothetical protein